MILAYENSQISIGDKTCTHSTLKGQNKVWLYVETSIIEIQREKECTILAD